MKRSTKGTLFLIFLLYLLSINGIFDAADIIDTTQTIRDGETMVSVGQRFELGFFSPGNSTNRYVGIWFSNVTVTVQTPVWVANRESPLRNTTSGVLRVTTSGQLVLQDGDNDIIWSSNNASRAAVNPVLQLLDSGNLVIREANNDRAENYLWQSFDYPTNTFLQGMDYGWNFVTRTERYITSWRSNDDPAPGDFSCHLDITGYPQEVIRGRDNTVLHRLGPWNGMRLSGLPSPRQDWKFPSALFMTNNSAYYREDAVDKSIISRFSLSPSGVGQSLTWTNRRQEWVVYYNLPSDICDNYRLCGAHGSCNIGNTPACGCLDRFVPRDQEGWVRSDWSGGCARRTNLSCQGDVFLRYSGIKMPDSRFTWYNESMSLEECREMCLRNCSCMAYTNFDVRNGGTGCLLWVGDLIDIRVLPGEEQVLYIRVAASELGSNRKGKVILIVSLTIVGIVLPGLSLLIYVWKMKKNGRKGRNRGKHENRNKDLELPLFDLSTISKATKNFSTENKLGEGGYGPVYKGTLEHGQEIAVKRLSKTSMQGLEEFKNEVIFVAKLQHRNLVKLLGCCIQGQEQMLIYEHMPNRSLDLILFDQANRISLDWPKRFQIVGGIARGIMYLHQDSRLRIIHRDLKASNILLDREMEPKISDFGIAKRFRENETEDRTSRVVGTYGYMSPEYAVHGRFSAKSDVFSFGVLVLELVSGNRNSGFSPRDSHLNLLGHVWTLYKEGRSIEIVDPCLLNSADLCEVLRVIHVGLLCVQQIPDDRPNMSSVVGMLSNHEVMLPQANHPGFFTENDTIVTDTECSVNAVTITVQVAR